MQLQELREHLRRGGAATLSHPAIYSVADGSVIAPARYAGRNGSEFVFETRFVDGLFQRTVLIDSKQSQANRVEEGLTAARRDGGAAQQIPTIEVRYDGREPLSDLDLPHRAVDAHIRFATQQSKPVIKQAWYRELRDSTPADLSAVFVTAPAVISLGGWDSSRRTGQLRLRGLLVSELFGVVAEDESALSRRSGARLDPLGQALRVTPTKFREMIALQRDELSPTLVAKLEKTVASEEKKKAADLSATEFNLGGIPPQTRSSRDGSVDAFGVSVPEVRRSRTYSLAGLRRLRFGGSADDDVAAREALLAMLLLGTAYADADPDLRAYCDVAAPRAHTMLDDGEVDLDLSIESCEQFLAGAIDRLPDRLAWRGQVQQVVGDPALGSGAIDVEQD